MIRVFQVYNTAVSPAPLPGKFPIFWRHISSWKICACVIHTIVHGVPSLSRGCTFWNSWNNSHVLSIDPPLTIRPRNSMQFIFEIASTGAASLVDQILYHLLSMRLKILEFKNYSKNRISGYGREKIIIFSIINIIFRFRFNDNIIFVLCIVCLLIIY